MKKNIVLFSSLVLGVLAINSFNTEVHAEKLSDATSPVDIQMLAGDENETHPPVGPTDPTDPENPGTGNTGLLTIDRVPNVKFGEVNISGSDQVEYAMNENPYTQVTDVRGTSAGWTLYVKADPFVSSKKDELKGATLSLKSSTIASKSTGKVITPPKGFNVSLTATNQKILMADKNSGEGTWMQTWKKADADEKNQNIQLAILAGTAKANTTYTTTIYWELQDAPGK
ncbi:hypothetical protein A5821_001256 [Enterococcus sp. 7F3_DIV0205]|uniref:WxL domain-containing protein n=1 Tax=Candidatus Enterococcus palustris TaxID=1834189 RepID=A0AAQ3Y5H7_9ENTE|nr:WxL domain-containing protein [Enterococcus sp. 7F3_DIV0205]OTN85654.1 hypothetical protein A5821_001600 [Enterococcus sp. 7F3_DIV0205]